MTEKGRRDRLSNTMNVEYSWIDSDLAAFQETARRFIAAEIVPHESSWAAQGHVDRSVWNRFGEVGMLCPAIPEAFGGGGGNFAHDAVVALEMARAMAVGPNLNVHSAIVAHYILRYGSEEQKRYWLPRMATGDVVAAIAMSEPGAGSDLKSIRTRAQEAKGGWSLTGSKTFISNGWLADLVVVVAKTDPSAGAKGISLFLVETKNLQGFRRGRILEKIGLKGQDTSELFFDDVSLPEASLLGGVPGLGFEQLIEQLPQERMLIALGCTATMGRAIDETLKYTRERSVFGGPLFAMQNTRFKLAECQTKMVVAQNFVDACMCKVLQGELDGATAAMAKWWCTQVNCEVIDECLQLHGGYGYILEYPIARMYVNARVGKIYGGTNEIMKELVARSL